MNGWWNDWQKRRKNLVNESDLEAFIDLSKQSWVFDNGQDQKIKKLLMLDDLTAEDVMTPRIKIKALDDTFTLEEAIKILTHYRFSRIPVYHTAIDDIDRVVTLKELLRFSETVPWTTAVHELALSPIIKVPTSQPIDTLLERFQKTHKHIAVVMDEYGGVDWVVSLEDIIEEVFWEIQDEMDEEEIPIKEHEGGDSYICQSYVRIDEILAVLGIEFEDLNLGSEFESETLSYFITSFLERYPIAGEELTLPIISTEESDAQKNLYMKILWVKKWLVWEVEVSVK